MGAYKEQSFILYNHPPHALFKCVIRACLYIGLLICFSAGVLVFVFRVFSGGLNNWSDLYSLKGGKRKTQGNGWDWK